MAVTPEIKLVSPRKIITRPRINSVIPHERIQIAYSVECGDLLTAAGMLPTRKINKAVLNLNIVVLDDIPILHIAGGDVVDLSPSQEAEP